MAAEVPVPGWLPPGWKVEVKTRKTGLKDKYYSHPLDGRKFRSKNEVLQYIESTKSETSIPQKVIPAPHATGVIVEKNKSIDGLPEGWIVEFKTRNGGVHAGRQDKYFIDPSTGYKFNSLTKVWNYLKTNEKGSGRSSTKHFLDKPARATKVPKFPHLRARRSLFGGQTSNSNASVKVNEFTSNNNSDSDLAGPDNSVCHNEDTSKLSAEHGDTTHVGCRNIKSNKDSDMQETESSVTKSLEECLFKEADPNQPMDKNLGISVDNEVNKNANDNKVELNHLADGGGSAVEWKRTKQLAGRSNNKRKRDYPPDESKVSKAIPLPPRRSSRLATLKDKLNSDLDNSELQVKVAGEQLESYPATRQLLGGLNQEALPEEGITAEMNSQSKPQVIKDAKDGANCPLQPPFGDLWPDPCLEFAFKTLTDAIPVECMPPNGWLFPSASPMKFQVSGGDQDVK